MAGFEKFVGHFTSPTSNDSSYSITGVGFTPKVVIFFPTGRTSTGAGSTSDVTFGIGAMTTTDQWCVVGGDQDAYGAMRVNTTSLTTRCIHVLDGDGVLPVESAYFVSMDGDGFTLNYNRTVASAYIVHYIALGGSHLSVAVGDMGHVGSSGTHESPSLGFAPVGYLLAASDGIALEASSASRDFLFVLGGGTSSTEEFAISLFNENDEARSDTGRGQGATRVFQQQNVGNSIYVEVEHSAFGADTFTVNTTVGATGPDAFYIAFGGSIDCFMGNFTLNTSGATQAVTVETDFQPDAILFMGTDQTADGAENDLMNSVGISDGTNHRGYAFGKDDNTASSEPTTNVSHTHCILSDMNIATGAADDADIDSFDANGFTIGHNVNPATAWRIGYFAIKDVPTPSLLDIPSRRRMAPLLAM